MTTASTYNGPSFAPSFRCNHSLPTATLSGRPHYPPILQMRTQAHAEGPTREVSVSRAALPWSGVASCPPLCSPGMRAGQEAPEGGSLSYVEGQDPRLSSNLYSKKQIIQGNAIISK